MGNKTSWKIKFAHNKEQTLFKKKWIFKCITLISFIENEQVSLINDIIDKLLPLNY